MNLHLNELMVRCLTFSLAVAMLPTGAALLAQTSGSLEGLVLDASRVPIAGAALLVKETETNAERRLSTDSRGRFLVPGLAPGHYRVEASHPGFRSKILRDIELTAGRAVWLEAVLELGELRESIEVTAEAQLLSTRADDWGASVEKRALESLPLNGRDLFNLTAQQPGVMSPSSSRNGPMTGTGVHVSVNGARANQNSFRLDGVYIGDWTSSAPASISGNLLGVEAIEEVRVVASLSARSTGARRALLSRP